MKRGEKIIQIASCGIGEEGDTTLNVIVLTDKGNLFKGFNHYVRGWTWLQIPGPDVED